MPDSTIDVGSLAGAARNAWDSVCGMSSSVLFSSNGGDLMQLLGFNVMLETPAGSSEVRRSIDFRTWIWSNRLKARTPAKIKSRQN